MQTKIVVNITVDVIFFVLSLSSLHVTKNRNTAWLICIPTITTIKLAYVDNKSTNPYSSVVSNAVYKGNRKKFTTLVLICPIAIIPVFLNNALFVSLLFILFIYIPLLDLGILFYLFEFCSIFLWNPNT